MDLQHKVMLFALALPIFIALEASKSQLNEVSTLVEVNPYAQVTPVCYVEGDLFVLVDVKEQKYQFPFKELIRGVKKSDTLEWLKSDKGEYYILFCKTPILPRPGYRWLKLDDKTLSTKPKELILPENVKKFRHTPIKITTIDKEMMKKIEEIIEKIDEDDETKTVD